MALDRHEHIKKGLKQAGSSLSKIARRLKVAPTTVTIVSQGHRRSRRIEAAIAQDLQTTAAELWPERYREPATAGES